MNLVTIEYQLDSAYGENFPHFSYEFCQNAVQLDLDEDIILVILGLYGPH